MKKRILISLSFFALTFFQVMPLIAQTDNKVVTLRVVGSGKTQEEAKQNALRSAIEQAFGAFISSNTQILDDKLTKDEIVSVSNGNIQEYSVISEVQTPDGYWSNTLRAKVAIDKLTSFCENKGVEVTFKGALFTLNIKQQILNEENEKKVIENMCVVVKKIFDKSFDFEVSAGDPKNSAIDESKWEIPLIITVKANSNIINASEYILKTLSGLSLTNEEVQNYTSLNKKIATMYFTAAKNPAIVNTPIVSNSKKNKKNKQPELTDNDSPSLELLFLRRKENIDKIKDLIIYLRKPITNFYIFNNVEIITGLSICGESDSHINFQLGLVSYDGSKWEGLYGDYYGRGCLYDSTPKYYGDNYDNKAFRLSFEQFKIGAAVAQITIKDVKNIEELSRISGYKIAPFSGSLLEDSKPVIGYFTDPRDGNKYKIVTIGEQTWFAENLKYLPVVTGYLQERRNVSLDTYKSNPYFFVPGYDDNQLSEARTNKNFKLHGVFYNYAAAKEACPAGWHLPSHGECYDLIEYVAMVDYIINNNGKALTEAGDLLKSKYSWKGPYGNYIDGYEDKYYFSANQDGQLGNFDWSGDGAEWWTNSTESGFYLSRDWSPSGFRPTIEGNYFRKVNVYTEAIPIRCIKDQIINK